MTPKRLFLASAALVAFAAAVLVSTPALAADGGTTSGTSCVFIVPSSGGAVYNGQKATMRCNWRGGGNGLESLTGAALPTSIFSWRIFFGTKQVGVNFTGSGYWSAFTASRTWDKNGSTNTLEVVVTVTDAGTGNTWPTTGACVPAAESTCSMTWSGTAYQADATVGGVPAAAISSNPNAVPPVTWSGYEAAWPPPAPPKCGTDGASTLGTLTAQRPKVNPPDGSSLNQVKRVEPGSYWLVSYPDTAANGVVQVKWADQPNTAYRTLTALGSTQGLAIQRPPGMPSTLTNGLLFRCSHPSLSGGAFFYSFGFDGTGEFNNYQPFLYSTSDATRPCAQLRIQGILETGVVTPTNSSSTFSLTPVASTPAVQIRVTGWDDTVSFTSAAFVSGTAQTFTIPGSTSFEDRQYDNLVFSCKDSQGWYSIGFGTGVAGAPVDALSEVLFPNPQDPSQCWKGAGFGLSPSSWVPAALRATGCLLRVSFIPSSMDYDALRRRVGKGTGQWTQPIEVLAGGLGSIGGVTGSCSYTVTLPINGGLPLVFDSCTGGVAQGRELVRTVSSVSMLLWGVVYLKRKGQAVITGNAERALQNEQIVLDAQDRREK